MNTVQQQWETYQSDVIAQDAHEIQIKETKRAFFAGVGAALALFETIGHDSISSDGKDAMIYGLFDEIGRFRNSVHSGTD